MLGRLGLLAFQESNVPRNRPGESRNLPKNKRPTKKTDQNQTENPENREAQKRFWMAKLNS
jgi:hypothetical protein